MNVLITLKKKQILEEIGIFVTILALTFLLRSVSFGYSVLDWDESLFLIMAQDLINGNLPYTLTWDHKPPGIYFIFSVAQIIFGQSVIAIRIITIIFITTSSYLLFRIGKDLLNSWKSGFCAALFYSVFSLQSGGLAACIEFFYAPFIILGFYNVFAYSKNQSKGLRYFTLGILFGISFIIKYITIFEFIALLIMILSINRKFNESIKRSFRGIIILISASLIPYTIITFIFYLSGYLKEFIYSNFTANFIHLHGEFSWEDIISFFSQIWNQIQQNFLLWNSLLFIPFILLKIKSNSGGKAIIVRLFIWFIFALFGIFYTRVYYENLFLQLLPSLSLIAVYIIFDILQIEENKTINNVAIILILLLGLFYPIANYSQLEEFSFTNSIETKNTVNSGDQFDKPQFISSYLNKNLDNITKQYLYIVDYEPIIYYLTKSKRPTKYIFPPFLLYTHFSEVAGINPIEELNAIMNHKPVYVIKLNEKSSEEIEEVINDEFYSRLNQYLTKYYYEEAIIADVILFRSKL